MPRGIYIRTEEYRLKMSISKMGSHLSDETRKKMSESAKKNGNKPPLTKYWLGKKLYPETKEKLSIAHKGKYREEDSPHWKKEGIGYGGIHRWVVRQLGKPQKCSKCNTIKYHRYEWANISRKYKRELTDWIRLCVPCHRKYDGITKSTIV